ncbi:hypothetical protein ACJMK2_042536 [Sinanodonta woodiana]|uniref:Lipase domain-containing protein n=1 Tax=Sinanodonta woodiana TaxID=1069815 RepID=A0ABD3W7Q1_SINWO
MKHAFLQKEDANVVVVSWEKGADNINYVQAAANTRVVGALVAQMMKAMHTNGHANYHDMHLIGHSLGSHIAGYAGERVPGTGRITGLDPAGPLFEHKDPKVRLDPSDALFVDAIHTDGDNLHELGFGLERPIGHADFYPNGGENQPGCPSVGKHLFNLITLKITRLVDGVACNHMRVLDLFTESITSACPFQAMPCPDKTQFAQGRCTSCGHGCAKMGYHASEGNPRGSFFFATNSRAPFCHQ